MAGYLSNAASGCKRANIYDRPGVKEGVFDHLGCMHDTIFEPTGNGCLQCLQPMARLQGQVGKYGNGKRVKGAPVGMQSEIV